MIINLIYAGAREACTKIEEIFNASCQGKFPVYRISLSLFCFFLIFCFLSSRLFCVGDRIRLYLHYKWFIVKIALFLVLMIIPLFIPDVVFYYYAWIALFMSGIFLVVQVILLVDFAYDWADKWRSGPESDGYTRWDFLMLLCAILLFLGAIAFIVVGFIFFGSGPTCHLNRFFLSFTIILGIIATIGSFVANRGLLPAAVVVCYTAFLCWSAALSDPSTECNKLRNDTTQETSLTSTIITAVFGVIFACFSLVRTAVSTGGSFGNFFKMNKDEEEEMSLLGNKEQDTGDIENRKECQQAFYSHIVFVFMSFYLAMVLSNWDIDRPEVSSFEYDKSLIAMWVKIACQWLTFAVFAWTLIAPRILKHRSFLVYVH
jgi:hypothetical protein